MNSGVDLLAGLRAMAQAALFPTEGELTLDGLTEPVAIRRDTWGVAYIEAGSLDDLWFANGVVIAGERLFQLDLALRAANGRLSEVFGERTLEDDRFARTVGFNRAGERIAATWDDGSIRMHERFRAGVAAWLAVIPALPLEYSLLDLKPQLPDDVGSWAAAFVYLSWGLSGNATQELLRGWIAERAGADTVARIMPPLPADPPGLPVGALDAGALHGALFDALSKPGGQGSNAWVVAASRTSTGSALLANDPHLEAVQPGVWIELHLSAPGYRARGVALPWSPGIVLGTTEHHAWGATNVTGDVQDLFIEELSDDRRAVRRGDGWEPLAVHRETIAVRGEASVELDVRASSHGPLLDTFPFGEGDVEYADLTPARGLAAGGPATAFALAWTGLDHAIQPSLAAKAASATSFEGFRAAVQGVTCPGQNFVYADVDGTIGYTCTGIYPVRRTGDGLAPTPADDGAHDWQGSIEAGELPWGMDPERGFLVTANNRMHDERYPHLIGHDFHPPMRAGRIAEVLSEGTELGVEAMAALQVDTVSWPAREIVHHIERLEPTTDDQRLAIGLVLRWDGDIGAGSASAAVFQLWSKHVARRVLVPQLGQELFARYHADRETWHAVVLPGLVRDRAHDDDVLGAFDDAVGELRERLGDDPTEWHWGALHRLRLAHPLASIPGLEGLFTAADIELGGDESTVLQAGFDSRDGYDVVVIPSWRALYDLADLDRSVGVLPAGNSGNPASPHWNDQAPLWLAGETHALPFSAAAVEEAAVAEMRLEPGTISG